jgi:hypothetical protein
MKRITLLVGFLVALVILGGVSAPTASAQALDGVWLKCKVNVKGYVVDPGTGVYSKGNGSFPIYLHFVWNGASYDVAVWTNPSGTWTHTSDTPAVHTTAVGENFIPDFFLHLNLTGTNYIETKHTPFIKSDTKGKVTYKGTGEVQFGSIDGGALNFYGYFNISGTSVDVSKLPFDPNP